MCRGSAAYSYWSRTALPASAPWRNRLVPVQRVVLPHDRKKLIDVDGVNSPAIAADDGNGLEHRVDNGFFSGFDNCQEQRGHCIVRHYLSLES